MGEKNISDLILRYEAMEASGKTVYFDPDEFDDLAEYYESYDDIDMALKVVAAGLQIHPLNESLLLKRGKYFLYEEKYEDALAFFKVHFSYYSFDLYLLKIECYLQLGMYAESYQIAKEMLADKSLDMGEALSELGFLYLGADYYNEAILYLDKSLEYIEDDRIDVLNDLAYAYEMKGDFESAIKTVDRLLDEDPYSYDTWINLGKLHSIQENFERAIDAFDFALTINDEDETVLKLKAHCLLLIGRVDEAINIFKDSIEKSPEDTHLYIALSECYMHLDDYESMLQIVEDGEKVDPLNPMLQAKKAIAFLYKGEVDEALSIVLENLKTDPLSLELNSLAGDVFFAKENYLEAKKYIEIVLNEEPDNPKALEKLASIYIMDADFQAAIDCLEKILELSPSLASPKRKLVLLYFEVGDKDKFLSYLEMISDEDLYDIYNLFYEDFDPKSLSRDELISRLSEARECRILFKNLKY